MVLETVIWGGTLTPRVRACIGMVRSTKQSFPTRDRDRRSGPRPGTGSNCSISAVRSDESRSASPPRGEADAAERAPARGVYGGRAQCIRGPSRPSHPIGHTGRPTGPRGRARAGAGADRAVDQTADTSRTPLHSAERTRQSATARTRGRAARAWSPPGPGPPPRAAAGAVGPRTCTPYGLRGARARRQLDEVMLQRCCIRMLYMTTHVYVL